MLLSSYIKDSFQEYEGHQSLVLFCQKCNLRCKECYNLKQVTDPSICVGEAREIITSELTPLHDAIVFLGGEPTVHPDLAALVTKVKEKGLKVKIYTNGLNPDVIQDLNEKQLVDAYSVDFKTIDNTELLGVNIDIATYIKNVTKSIDNIIANNIPLEIRTTLWTDVNINKIKEYLNNKYPNIKHIIQKKFDIKA